MRPHNPLFNDCSLQKFLVSWLLACSSAATDELTAADFRLPRVEPLPGLYVGLAAAGSLWLLSHRILGEDRRLAGQRWDADLSGYYIATPRPALEASRVQMGEQWPLILSNGQGLESSLSGYNWARAKVLTPAPRDRRLRLSSNGCICAAASSLRRSGHCSALASLNKS